MKATRELRERLDALISQGCTITLGSGEKFVLASASWYRDGLWWCAAFPQSEFDCHLTECETAVSKPGGIELFDVDGRLIGSVWKLEPTLPEYPTTLDEEGVWNAWLEQRDGWFPEDDWLEYVRMSMTGENAEEDEAS